jgi:hypothetical protein
MKKNKLLLFLLVPISFIWLESCTDSQASGTKASAKPPALPPLNAEDLFKEDRVYDFLFDSKGRATDSLEARSKAEFLKAIDLFRNKKQAEQSIPLFITSLQIFPTPKTYNELGDAYYEVRNFEKALECYRIAIRLNYQPLGETYFHMACMDAYKEEGNTSGLLNLAFRNGFSDSLRFVSEPALTKFRNTSFYGNLFEKHFTNNASGRNAHFQSFLFAFSKLPENFLIEESEVGTYDYSNELSYEYSEFIEEMENVSFGRDVSNIFVAEGILKETPTFTLILYKSVEMYSDYPPVYTMMASYNTTTGELIDKKVFACNCSAESVKTGKVENNVITVEEKERVWESPIKEVSLEKNKVLEYRTKSSTQYNLQSDGKIQLLPTTAKN